MADKDTTDLTITYEEHKAFLEEPTYEGKIKILIKHSKKNNLRIKRSITMEQEKTEEQIEKEMDELGKEFGEFIHKKGITAKFRLAFANMGESAKAQRGQDKIQFEERRRQSAADNADFIEFIHTKGFKAKCRLVIENIKKGAAESRQKNAKQQTQTVNTTASDKISAEELSCEFNTFLKEKGLDDEYIVITDSNKE